MANPYTVIEGMRLKSGKGKFGSHTYEYDFLNERLYLIFRRQPGGWGQKKIGHQWVTDVSGASTYTKKEFRKLLAETWKRLHWETYKFIREGDEH